MNHLAIKIALPIKASSKPSGGQLFSTQTYSKVWNIVTPMSRLKAFTFKTLQTKLLVSIQRQSKLAHYLQATSRDKESLCSLLTWCDDANQSRNYLTLWVARAVPKTGTKGMDPNLYSRSFLMISAFVFSIGLSGNPHHLLDEIS